MQTRRKFLKDASKAMLITSMTTLAGLVDSNRLAAASAQLNYGTFAGLVRTPFRAFAGNNPVADLVLVQARAHHSPSGGECFSLLFRGAGEDGVEQGTYRFAHAALGDFQMFVVPKPGDRHGHYVEAVFNRLS